MQQVQIKVRGMMCSFCVQTIDKALRRPNGVERINVSLAHEEALVGYDPGRVSAGQIVTTLTRLGYEAWQPGVDDPAMHRSAEVRYGETPRLLLCAYAKIRQNLLWAFFFNAVGIPIAASGWLHPTIAIAAMASSTLGILPNSFGLRLSRLAMFSVPSLDIQPAAAQPAVDGVSVEG